MTTRNDLKKAEASSEQIDRLPREDIGDRFKSICKGLPRLDYRNLKCSTKIVVLLAAIDSRDRIAATLESGVTDYWLPLPTTCFPRNLGPGEHSRFRMEQPRFLEASFELDGRHFHLCQDAMPKTRGVNIPKTLKFCEILGDGGFADVSKVEAANGKTYALKRIQREKTYDKLKQQMQAIKAEIEILKKVDFLHCISFVGSYAEINTVGIVMEPVAEWNLETYLEEFTQSKSDQRRLASFFGCLITALKYLHYDLQVRHKDIKPRNILVTSETIMLTDFGTSLDWGEQSGHTTTQEERRRSPVYCAPEAADDTMTRNSSSDIWSMGCVFLEMTAVLKGKPRAFVGNTLREYGDECFRNNPEGIKIVIETLKREGAPQDNIPLEWVEAMLKRDKEDRKNCVELRDMVINSRGRTGRAFCGFCCNQEPNHDDAGTSDGESTQSYKLEYPAADQTPSDHTMMKESAKIYDPQTTRWHDIGVLRTEKSNCSWISQELVDRCHILASEGPRQEMEYGNQKYQSTKFVSVQWYTGDSLNFKSDDCWVVQGIAPFEMLIGCD